LLGQGRIGHVRRIEFAYSNRGRTVFENQPFIKTLPHYIITDFGSHLFDLVRFLFGEPESIYCHALKTYEEIAGEDSLTATLRYKDKICTCSVSENVCSQIFIDGDEGTMEMLRDDSIRVATIHGTEVFPPPDCPVYDWASHVYSYLPAHCIHSIVECNRSFHEAFINGTIPETDAKNNLKTMKIVYAACKSTEENQVVLL
ncbi:MAG: Gfo/Idh/MocA family oxidoreductase, partial [Clostridiales bacterium]|nr:Gfo/Idh/MocA family oxidoreductase [Clostridiales bacterium]